MIPPACDHKINGNGLISIPGAIDTHVHYGVYSPINEAAKTESHAAAIGGITTMMRMLRLENRFSNSLQEQLTTSSEYHYVDYAIHASIFNPQQIDEMNFCIDKGITSFKIYMNLGGEVGHVYMDMPPNSPSLVTSKVNVTDELVEKNCKKCSTTWLSCTSPTLKIMNHVDVELKKQKKKTKTDCLHGLLVVHLNLKLKQSKQYVSLDEIMIVVIYFVHIGSERALLQIQEEKKLGTRIFVETCPHYLTLSYEKQNGYLAKVMPPIRTENESKSCLECII